jgi:hypothetical protein
MHIPKHYFHDRLVLGILGANVALFLVSFLSVMLGVDPSRDPTSIVAYRATTQIGQISGPTSDLYQFGIFAIIATVAAIVLSVKLYTHRRYLAMSILGLNLLLLLMNIIIFNALTKTL